MNLNTAIEKYKGEYAKEILSDPSKAAESFEIVEWLKELKQLRKMVEGISKTE